jgi:hypothetical protein
MGPAMNEEVPLDAQGHNLSGMWTDAQYYVRLEVQNTGKAAWTAGSGAGALRLASINPSEPLLHSGQPGPARRLAGAEPRRGAE